MPPARKDTPAASDNLMLIVGQLLEATKAASDGLKGVSQETQANGKAIITVSTTVDTIEEKLAQIDRIIRDTTYQGNLVGVAKEHADSIRNIVTSVAEIRKELSDVKSTVTGMTVTNNHGAGVRKALMWVLGFVAWIVTTIVALYGAWNNGNK